SRSSPLSCYYLFYLFILLSPRPPKATLFPYTRSSDLYRAKTMTVDGRTFREGEDYLSIDGTSGTVYAGQLRSAPSDIIQGLLHGDRKSTRLNSSHSQISYAVFCLKKKTHHID